MAALSRTIAPMIPASTAWPTNADAAAAITRINTSGFMKTCQTSESSERDEHGVGPVLSQDRHRRAPCLFEQREQQVGGFNAGMARAVGVVERQLAHEPRSRRHPHLGSTDGRHRS